MPKRCNKNVRLLYALQDFLNGLTLSEIAEKYGVRIGTVQQWYAREKWKEKRDAAIAEAQKTIYVKFRKSIAETTENLLEISKIGSKLALLRFQKSQELVEEADDEQRIELLSNEYETIKKWGALAKDFAAIQRGIMPQASEELSKEMHEELKRIGDAGLFYEEQQ